MTIVFIVLAVCVYDLCGLLTVLYLNHSDSLTTVDGARIADSIVFDLLDATIIGDRPVPQPLGQPDYRRRCRQRDSTYLLAAAGRHPHRHGNLSHS